VLEALRKEGRKKKDLSENIVGLSKKTSQYTQKVSIKEQ
jgi:hypothetical protein